MSTALDRLHLAAANRAALDLTADEVVELVAALDRAARALEEADAQAVLDAMGAAGTSPMDRLRVADMAAGRAHGYRAAAILVRRALGLGKAHDAPMGDQGLTPTVAR